MKTSAVILALVLILVACAGKEPTGTKSDPGPTDIRAFIAPGADVPLTPSGRFIIQSPAEPVAILSASRARDLATTYLRIAAPQNIGIWEHEHGGTLDYTELQASVVSYAASPYAAETLPRPEGNQYGPYYLVQFVDAKGVSALNIAVSAYATYLTSNEGRIQFPPRTNTEFFTVGTPASRPRPMAPEAAARLVALSTGAAITTTPALIRRAVPFSPQMALWRITLDRAVRVRGAGGRETFERTLLVDPGGRIFRSAPNQPRSAPALVRGATGPERIEIPLRPGRPLVIDTVTVVR